MNSVLSLSKFSGRLVWTVVRPATRRLPVAGPCTTSLDPAASSLRRLFMSYAATAVPPRSSSGLVGIMTRSELLAARSSPSVSSLPPFVASRPPFVSAAAMFGGSLSQVRYSSTGSSTTNISEEITANLVGQSISVPTEVTEATSQLIASVPEVAELSTGFSPTGMLAGFLSNIHDWSGMPWWATIAAATLVFRCMIFPLVVYTIRNNRNLMVIKPDIVRIQDEMSAKRASGSFTQQEQLEYALQLREKFKTHNCHPLKSFFIPLAQAPLFITFFMTLRKMAAENPELKTGGLGWFTDLSIPDPYYLLPVLSSMSFLLMIEIGTDTGVQAAQQSKWIKNLFRGLGVIMIPVTAQFPAALFCYWLSSNVFSLGQSSLLFHNKGVQKFFNIPDVPLPPPGTTPGQTDIQAVKNLWSKALNEAKERREQQVSGTAPKQIFYEQPRKSRKRD